MRLTELPARLIEDAVRTWSRRLIAGGIAAVCGLIVFLELLSASRHALQAAVGPVGARLILAAIFAVFIAAAIAWVMRAERSESKARKAAARAPASGDDKVAAIAEAVQLGYALARDLRQARTTNGAAPGATHAAGAADPGDPASVRSTP